MNPPKLILMLWYKRYLVTWFLIVFGKVQQHCAWSQHISGSCIYCIHILIALKYFVSRGNTRAWTYQYKVWSNISKNALEVDNLIFLDLLKIIHIYCSCLEREMQKTRLLRWISFFVTTCWSAFQIHVCLENR